MARTRCPFAVWSPLGRQTEPFLRNPDIVCLHTMVGSLMGTEAYFTSGGYSGTESHFGVGGRHDGDRNGQIRQWQALDHTADANADGNDNVISIETSDGGQWQEPWNPEQVDAIVKLVRWLCDEFDIPKRLIPDTRPGRRGIGYHRQGIDPYRVSNGVVWSQSYGKACPGDARIAQIENEIIPRIQGDDDMPSVAEVVDGLLNAEVEMANGSTWRVKTILKNLEKDTDPADVFQAVWRGDKLAVTGSDDTMFPEHMLGQTHYRAGGARAEAREDQVNAGAPERVEVRELGTQVAALTAVVEQLRTEIRQEQ